MSSAVGSLSPLRARVHVDRARVIGAIDRRIFGGFLEHVGRAIYGGVFDPGGPMADERGFRRDVIQAVRELGVTCVRYPGGNFASAYDWRDGTGPRAARPARLEPAWQQLEPNAFGTDEFRAWSAAGGCEPVLTANLGSGTPADAAAWVEYCNRSRHSPEGGAPRPVRLWCLGNEIDGPWQIGHTSADAYAAKALAAARQMRRVDPSLELVLAGSSGEFLPTYLHWDRAVLEACWDDVQYLGIHRYSHNREGDTRWYLAEGVAVEAMIRDFRSLLEEAQSMRGGGHRVYLAIDEWNVWYRAKGEQHERGGWQVGAPLLQEGYNVEDALVVAQYLNAFLRNADLVRLACLAQLVNALAPIITTATGLLKQTIYYPFALFARHATGASIAADVQGPDYDAGERSAVPALDAAATFEEAAGQGSVFLVNRLIDEAVKAAIALPAGGAATAAWRLAGGSPRDANTTAQPDRVISVPIEPPRTAADGVIALELPPLSLTVVKFAEPRP